MGLLQQIEAERRGDTVDRVLLGHVLRSLTSLGFYQTAFQTPFLQQTTEFYATEGLQLMATSDVPDYLKHAEVRPLSASLLHVWSAWLLSMAPGMVCLAVPINSGVQICTGKGLGRFSAHGRYMCRAFGCAGNPIERIPGPHIAVLDS